MKVTGQLKPPSLAPCPGSNDITKFVDSECRPVTCPRPADLKGLDCCQNWSGTHGQFSKQLVWTNHVDPESFNYDQYRYQVYAKPADHDKYQKGAKHQGDAVRLPDKFYAAPSTDIRALKQTLYIPVLPSKPGGETEVTFPMTDRTMGQPDVTSACCVPVIPCNPGFQNLTSCVLPDPRLKCQTYDKCKHPEQLAPRRPDVCSRKKAHSNPEPRVYEQQQQQGYHSSNPPRLRPSQSVVPPSNQPSNAFFGAPDVFPYPDQRYVKPPAEHFGVPHYDGSFPTGHKLGNCSNNCNDGVHGGIGPDTGYAQTITSLKAFRYVDRVQANLEECREDDAQRYRRLNEMYGAFGANLQPKQCHKRHVPAPKESIRLQGNGFAWSYPKYKNQLCYVVERNYRC